MNNRKRKTLPITLAFYKGMGEGQDRGRKFTSYLIAFWTTITERKKSNHTHVEIIFPNGRSFSSSGWDKGVRGKVITYAHPERWTFVTLMYSEADVDKMLIHSDSHVGEGYDYKGIAGSLVFPFGLHNANEWFCSEICNHILGWKPERVTPERMLKKLVKRIKSSGGKVDYSVPVNV